jgi:hypothetical protein
MRRIAVDGSMPISGSESSEDQHHIALPPSRQLASADARTATAAIDPPNTTRQNRRNTGARQDYTSAARRDSACDSELTGTRTARDAFAHVCCRVSLRSVQHLPSSATQRYSRAP